MEDRMKARVASALRWTLMVVLVFAGIVLIATAPWSERQLAAPRVEAPPLEASTLFSAYMRADATQRQDYADFHVRVVEGNLSPDLQARMAISLRICLDGLALRPEEAARVFTREGRELDLGMAAVHCKSRI
jgi:hypothetical protein